jgi:hypothetical protein
MPYRNPIYAFLHAARDAGAAAISTNNAFAPNAAAFLVDDQAGALGTFTDPETNHQIDLNRGAAGLEELTSLIIPEGHNLNGSNIRVQTDDNPGFSSPTVIKASTAISSAQQIIAGLTIGGETARRYQYVRLDFPSSGSINPELPELIYTAQRTTSRGLEPGWLDMLAHNTLEFPKESGAEAALALGPDRRILEYRYRDVIEAADFALFDELLAECGTARPFWLWPPWTEEAPLWVRLAANVRQQQDPSVPAATISPRRQIDLSAREHLA